VAVLSAPAERRKDPRLSGAPYCLELAREREAWRQIVIILCLDEEHGNRGLANRPDEPLTDVGRAAPGLRTTREINGGTESELALSSQHSLDAAEGAARYRNPTCIHKRESPQISQARHLILYLLLKQGDEESAPSLGSAFSPFPFEIVEDIGAW
jgi:hypothetical protein